MAHTYKYPRPALAVDCVVFGYDPGSGLQVILVRRGEPPFPDQWALPGGHVEEGETLETAASRELDEETGARVSYLEQLYTFADPGRDPRGWVVSVAYYALVRTTDYELQGGDDAIEARWFPVKQALKKGFLVFDHTDILRMALERLRGKIRYAPIGFNLLPPSFSIGTLRQLYEVVLGRPLNKSNFQKRIRKLGVLVESDDMQENVSHRPAKLYRFSKRAYDKAVRDGVNFEI